ncbi:unnamed protein product (macronuclear) [Paramecium tetraurelia]|uniref:Uncharacterized protein n=1 Tax=Paramecium tetraurelia TaxID=5888 RepID=A0E5C5_PARTE|nr:uncharacterized protein GSPATT00023669001 [Paramecium tetraurelia]CAK90492.1 unnamed protein product [Paramecium tetraurelia]|eukprot:XP_001457889.1 hypothetical protein (macronuclear) [Paramecium tetraurelia strain d4-2]
MEQQLQILFQRLEEFKQDQNEYWEEVKQLSDETDENQLPVILENEEDCNSSEILTILNQIMTLVNHLREGEIKVIQCFKQIIERYKYELKQLALELKETQQYNKEMKSISIQTDQDQYEKMYFQERQRYSQLEKKFEGLKRLDESSFKQDVMIELATLKNKIQILTETSTEAETLLIKKDQQVKEYQKQLQKCQKELTQKRAELSSLNDQLKSKDINLQMSQNMNRTYETELQKVSRKNSGSLKRPTKCYETLTLEIQELTYNNSQLKQQLLFTQRRLKELASELQAKEQQLVEVLNQIDEIKQHMQQTNKEDELKEAMEYLELKDIEIDRLHRELDNYKRNVKDNPQIRDLQNLLLVMSRNLQEKEQQLLRYQQYN